MNDPRPSRGTEFGLQIRSTHFLKRDEGGGMKDERLRCTVSAPSIHPSSFILHPLACGSMLTPPRALPPGGHIAVLAASGPSDRSRIEQAARVIESRGYRVTIAGNVDHRYRGYLAGSDEERATELNAAFRSDQYDAFFFARGGYGAMRILEQLDYDAIRRNPRPIVGFSDVTALHQAVAVRSEVVGFHGPMLNLDFHQGLPAEIEQWLWSMLAGEAPMVHRFDAGQIVAAGEAEGVLFGGCLALTDSLAGTPFDFWIDGGI